MPAASRPSHTSPSAPTVGVVIATRNRREGLLVTLSHLSALRDRPPIVVVDNGSGDGTVAAVRAAHPGVRTIALPSNLGAGARNLGVRELATRYVAFADNSLEYCPTCQTGGKILADRRLSRLLK